MIFDFRVASFFFLGGGAKNPESNELNPNPNTSWQTQRLNQSRENLLDSTRKY